MKLKNKLKYILGLLITICMTFILFAPNINANKQIINNKDNVASNTNVAEVLIENKTTFAQAFPDENFRTYIVLTLFENTEYRDTTDKSNLLEGWQIAKIRSCEYIDVSSKGIASLEGIQHFINLTTLQAQDNNLMAFDATGLINLYYLNLNDNNLSKLELPYTPNLTILLAKKNNLSGKFDLSNFYFLEYINIDDNQISELNLSDLSNVTSVYANNNLITKLDAANMPKLINLSVENNKLTILNLESSEKIEVLIVASNPNLNNLLINENAKDMINTLRYHYTNIDVLDLSGFTALTSLSATKTINADLSKINEFYVSESKPMNSSLIRLSDIEGALKWDATSGYYVINENTKGSYSVSLPYSDNLGTLKMIESLKMPLNQGGLMDQEGNLVIGAKLSDVNSSKNMIISNNNTVVTGQAIYTFTKDTSLEDGKVYTQNNFTIDKNTLIKDSVTGKVKAQFGGNKLIVQPKTGTVTITLKTGKVAFFDNTIITTSNGDQTITIGTGIIHPDGSITSEKDLITVPFDKVSQIKVDESNNITVPAGSTITKPDGAKEKCLTETTIDVNGNIIVDVAQVINNLFNQDKTKLAKGINQQDINNASVIVSSMVDGSAKNAFKLELVKAQLLLDNINDALDKVNDLFDETGTLKKNITLDQIYLAQKAVVKLYDSALKTDLQNKISDALKQIANRIDTLKTDKALFLLNKIETLDRTKYTSKSLALVDAAKINVVNILKNSFNPASRLAHPSQTELDKAVNVLQDAYDKLVLKETSTNNHTNNESDKNKQINNGLPNSGSDNNILELNVLLISSISLLVLLNRKTKEYK